MICLRSIPGILVTLYLGAQAFLPAAHQDLSCHLTSSTHCIACLIGSADGRARMGGSGLLAPLVDLGGLFMAGNRPVSTPSSGVRVGRAPPAR